MSGPKTPRRFPTWYDRHGRTVPVKPGSPRETARGLPAGGTRDSPCLGLKLLPTSTPISTTLVYPHVKRRVRKRQHLTGAPLIPCQVLNHGTAPLTCRDNPPRGRIMIGAWPHLPHRRFPGAFLPSPLAPFTQPQPVGAPLRLPRPAVGRGPGPLQGGGIRKAPSGIPRRGPRSSLMHPGGSGGRIPAASETLDAR